MASDDDDVSNLDIFRYAPRNVLVVLYAVFFPLIAISNLSVLYVLLSSAKMRTSTNIYITSICFASFLVGLFTCISSLHELTASEDIGTSHLTVCVMFVYLEIMAITACTLSFTATAVDRYRTIVQSNKPRFSLRATCCILAGVWIVALLYACRTFIQSAASEEHESDEDTSTTKDWLETNKTANGTTETMLKEHQEQRICSNFLEDESDDFIFRVIDMFVIFLVPLIVMSVLYSLVAVKLWASKGPTNSSTRDKRKTLRLLLIIVALFFFCWSPFHLFEVIHDSLETQGLELETASFSGARVWSLVLAISNSWLNPIVYCYLNRNFRVELKKKIRYWRVCCCRSRVFPEDNQQGTTETTQGSD
ncbi:neuromedin-K receptor-like [Liolophura sinensis]|uniref:neuromedin-K receptor-like n=1 Tax=Liolophura sinensis TaxID=3198878 RepID=UPI003158E0F4